MLVAVGGELVSFHCNQDVGEEEERTKGRRGGRQHTSTSESHFSGKSSSAMSERASAI